MGNCVSDKIAIVCRQIGAYPRAFCAKRIAAYDEIMSPCPTPVCRPPKFLTGLIGAPIAHSASPAMHEQAAEALGLRCHYQLIEIAGAGPDRIARAARRRAALGFAGVNVTYPYKEAVVALLDELAPGARAMGAVNTVVVRDGRLIGHNTDTTGFARAAAPLVADSGHGAGGADRRRRRRQGDRLCAGRPERGRASDLRCRAGAAPNDSQPFCAPMTGVVVADSVEQALQGAVGLVNGTPVGMLPNRTRRSRMCCCTIACGSPMRSTIRSGPRC